VPRAPRAVRSSAARTSDSRGALGRGRKERDRVLVVDDDVALADVLTRFLARTDT